MDVTATTGEAIDFITRPGGRRLAYAQHGDPAGAPVLFCHGWMTSRMRGYVKLLRAAPWLAGPLLRGTPARFRKDPDKAFAKQFGDLCPSDAAALEVPAAGENLLAAAVESLAGGHAG